MSSSMLTTMLDGAGHRFARGTLAWRLVALRSLASHTENIHFEAWRMRACFAVADVAARTDVRLPCVSSMIASCVTRATGTHLAKRAIEELLLTVNSAAMAHAARALSERGARSTEHAVLASLHAHGRAATDAYGRQMGTSLRHMTETGVVRRFGVLRFLGPVARAREFRPSLALVAALCEAGRPGRAAHVAERLDGRDAIGARAWRASAEHAAGAEREAHRLLGAMTNKNWVDFALDRMVHADLSRGRTDDALARVSRISSEPRRDRATIAIAVWLLRNGDAKKARRLVRRCRKTHEVDARDMFEAEAAMAEERFADAGAWLAAVRKRLGSRKPQSAVERVAAPHDHAHRATRLATLALALALASRGVIDQVRHPDAAEFLESEEALSEALSLSRVGTSLGHVVGRLEGSAARVGADALRYAALRAAADALRGMNADAACPPRERALVAGVCLAEDDDAAREPAMSERRALYDEGVSLSDEASRRRKALVRAAKWCLKQAVARDDPADDGLVAARLRCVSNLGTAAGTAVLRDISTDAKPNRHLANVVATLSDVAPKEAAAVLSTRFEAVVARRDNPLPLFAKVEQKGGFEEGFTDRWRELRRELRRRRIDADAWWDELARRWHVAHGGPVPPGCLERLIACADATHGGTAGETFTYVTARARRALERPYAELPRALVEDRTALAIASSTHRGPALGLAPLSLEAWCKILGGSAINSGRVSEAMVTRFARQLRGGNTVAKRMLCGRSPAAPLDDNVRLRGDVSLRFLDKRRDFFAYLRFADTAPCCFNSESSYYGTMSRWVFGVWRDPLTFCFLVLRKQRALGFVFGTYGWLDGLPVALLNGVYLRKQHAGLRASVLAAIEARLCQPLGLGWLGVACLHGGSGSMPEGYERQVKSVHRLRALTSGTGAPVTEIYDDISREVNVHTQMGLFWKRLLPRRC